MKTEEIEVKLNYKNKEELILELGERAIFEKKVTTKDRYFSQKYDDMSNAHDLVRIRQINNNETELTFKGSTLDKDKIWQRVELSVNVDSANMMHQILTSLEFEVISENECEREYWRVDDLELVFVKFTKPTTLKFMEIEGDSYEKVNKLIKTLGNQVERVGEETFYEFDKKREEQKKEKK